jgi:3-hydroxyisobutyrate dehydrogenase-like beta-hydroxyacid dehydrogenase
VQGYNRTTAEAESLVALGLTLAATPRAAALGAGVVFSMVSDGDALTEEPPAEAWWT